MAKRYTPLDPKTAFAEEAVTVAESGVVQAGEEDVVLAVGPGRYDAWWVVDVSAMGISEPTEEEGETPATVSDEGYRLILQGCDTEDFDAGEGDTIVNLAVLDLGAAAALLGGATDQVGPGRYVVPVSNEIKQQQNALKFVRLYVLVTNPEAEGEEEAASITFKSWLSKHPGA